MALLSSLGFPTLTSAKNVHEYILSIVFFLIVIATFAILSHSCSHELTRIYSILYNNGQFKTIQKTHNSIRYTNVTYLAQATRIKSAAFSLEQRINRLQRSNKHNKRIIEQSPRIIYRNITVTNDILHPVRVFHRPGEKAPYILELYVVTDERFVSSFLHDVVQIVTRVNGIFKVVNALFARFNVQFVVVGLEIWEKNRLNLAAEEHFLKTLANFKLAEVNVRHDCLFALLGDIDQTSTTRGKANNKVMCKYSSCVSFVRDSPYMEVNETARTAAHELGHNFGLRHDTEDCECQGCIMATGVEFGTGTMEWSPCSVRDMSNLLHYGMGACLRDLPVHSHSSILSRQTRLIEINGPSVIQIYTTTNVRRGTPEMFQSTPGSVKMSLCGNAKLDPDEECDCGTAETCPKEVQACCDTTSCRLRAGAECASGPCCDIQSVFGYPSRAVCRLKPSGSVCRAVGNSCDLLEYCDGASEWCPSDVFKADGEACYTREGYKSYCIRGRCNTADEWCRLLWGPTGTAAGPGCVGYNLVRNDNHAVDEVANCGRHRPRGDERWRDVDQWPSKACNDWTQAECGRLWCIHRNEKAMLIGWQEQQQRVDPYSRKTCAALVYDPVDPFQHSEAIPETGFPGPGWGDAASVTQDAGMTPDGVPCQNGLCYNGTCIHREELPFRKTCNCNSNGVCNNLGHCHCGIGYAPPACTEHGNGGSVDSGPPPPSWGEYGFIFAICFIVFILCPAFLLCMYCLLCRCRGRRFFFPKSEPLPPPSFYVEPFDYAAFFASIWHCCRKYRPRFDNDPPIIMTFGPPGMIKNGPVFTTSSRSVPANSHFMKTTPVILNGSAAVHPVAADEARDFSASTFRRGPMQEVNKDSENAGFSRDLKATWKVAESETSLPKDLSGSRLRLEISSPRLESTTFKGKVRSLASAARIQRVARCRGSVDVACPKTLPTAQGPASPVGGTLTTLNELTKLDISAPTLQTSTYKYALIELPEAYSTLKNPQSDKKSEYPTRKPKR